MYIPYTYMHVASLSEKKAMDLTENEEGVSKGLGKRNGREK